MHETEGATGATAQTPLDGIPTDGQELAADAIIEMMERLSHIETHLESGSICAPNFRARFLDLEQKVTGMVTRISKMAGRMAALEGEATRAGLAMCRGLQREEALRERIAALEREAVTQAQQRQFVQNLTNDCGSRIAELEARLGLFYV